jgi:CheY-like chemotaxis protein
MRLLCVEDDRVNALLLEQSCRHAGDLTLQFAETGADALEQVVAFAPDLLVIDLYLPDTDGYALLAALRKALAAPALPAVLCTAATPDDVGRDARLAGFLQVWSKPVSADVIRATLARLRPQA